MDRTQQGSNQMDETERLERLHASAGRAAQSYYDQILKDLHTDPPLLRLTRYYLIMKLLAVLNKGAKPIGGVTSGHDIISWVLGTCMRYRKAHPKKPEEEKHRFEG